MRGRRGGGLDTALTMKRLGMVLTLRSHMVNCWIDVAERLAQLEVRSQMALANALCFLCSKSSSRHFSISSSSLLNYFHTNYFLACTLPRVIKTFFKQIFIFFQSIFTIFFLLLCALFHSHTLNSGWKFLQFLITNSTFLCSFCLSFRSSLSSLSVTSKIVRLVSSFHRLYVCILLLFFLCLHTQKIDEIPINCIFFFIHPPLLLFSTV